MRRLLAALSATIALTGACDAGTLVCHTEPAPDGGADLEVCQRFPAPLDLP